MSVLHAGLVALRQHEVWRGALVIGESGAGKSDLMLRALSGGFRLVSDDRTVVWASAGRVYGRAPEALSGLVEARGLGVLSHSALPLAEVALVVACEPPDAQIERMPPPVDLKALAGVDLPLIRVHALEASALSKLRLALDRP
jgi:serine kinase of HPr protein (carbohydrate metabolism regulator)